MTTVDLTLTPLRSGLLAGKHNTVTVLVRATAPEAPERLKAKRVPLNLALVIDRSGSMGGQPLHEAKRCAAHIVRGLKPDDRAAIVAYDSDVEVLARTRKVGDGRRLLGAIQSIHTGGATALYDGWRLGADQVLIGQKKARSLSRVLLLSDGCANRGLTDPEKIASRVSRARDLGVTTSTYGLGRHFNEDLMMEMGSAGGGNSYYGQCAEDLIDPFQEELELLGAICGRNLTLKLDTPSGIKARVLNQYDRDVNGHWRLPNLAYGGEAWALVELEVSKNLARKELDTLKLLDATLQLEPREMMASTGLRLPCLSRLGYSSLKKDKTVRARTQEIRAAEIQKEARQAAQAGDWSRVDELLAIARKEAKKNPWLESALERLTRYANQRDRGRFSKEAYYSAHRLHTRLADPNECSDDYDLALESSKASYLRRKNEQGKRLSR
jgi:Ca-activated chloride channel family protein